MHRLPVSLLLLFPCVLSNLEKNTAEAPTPHTTTTALFSPPAATTAAQGGFEPSTHGGHETVKSGHRHTTELHQVESPRLTGSDSEDTRVVDGDDDDDDDSNDEHSAASDRRDQLRTSTDSHNKLTTHSNSHDHRPNTSNNPSSLSPSTQPPTNTTPTEDDPQDQQTQAAASDPKTQEEEGGRGLLSQFTTLQPNITVFQRHVLLDSDFAQRCFAGGEVRTFYALHLELEVRVDIDSSTPPHERRKIRRRCALRLVVPDEQVVKVQVLNFTSRCDNVRRLHVVDSGGLDTLVDACRSTFIAGEFSLTSQVSVHLTHTTQGRNHHPYELPFLVHLQLTAVAPADNLEMGFEGLKRGYIQTPRWDGQVHYLRGMDSRVNLGVPEQHSVMVSVYSLDLGGIADCSKDNLRVYQEVLVDNIISVGNILLLCGNTQAPNPGVYQARALVFIFKTDTVSQHPGFRALFSFHALSRTPQRIQAGLWNCSVAEWPQFRQHFPCNLESNCLHSEDEDGCHYVSRGCGKGVVTVGRGCYVLHNLGEARLTYEVVRRRCQAEGGYVASLNTEREWREVWQALRLGRWKEMMLGLWSAPSSWPPMYKEFFHWADGSVAYYLNVYRRREGPQCFFFIHDWGGMKVVGGRCYNPNTDQYALCELPSPHSSTPLKIKMPPTSKPQPSLRGHVTCPSGHLTHNFLACDLDSHCWADSASASASCHPPLTMLPPMFACSDGRVTVPYTLVCDHRQDCDDNSDEHFCVFPPCLWPHQLSCDNGQCVPKSKVCDWQMLCWDKSHQRGCPKEHVLDSNTNPPPGIIDMDERGLLQVTSLSPARSPDGSLSCPETHMQCGLDHSYCLPVYLRCNQVYDCPGHEDEAQCHNFTCPGFYRCRASQVCLHGLHVCDGLYQCPQHDDEVTCDLHCPPGCTCHGLAFTCTSVFAASQHPHLKHLNASGTFMTFAHLHNNTMLVYLNLGRCNLTHLPRLTFPNLQLLDLGGNRIEVLHSSHVTSLPHLKTLSLSSNPLSVVVVGPSSLPSSSLHSLDLSHTSLVHLATSNLTSFRQLHLLNLSGSGVQRVSAQGFQPFPHLRVVDLRGCQVREFSPGLMEHLQQLQQVWADNYKLCCPAVLPAGFPMAHCQAPSDEISSCDTLLRSDFFRLFLYVYAFLALTGNAGSFLYRTFVSRGERKQGFGVFVAHLCMSDLLMGLYLTAIGVADRLYQGSYLWEDIAWRNSAVCKMAGFFSLVSSEVSTFLICLITVDRFLVLRFPFSRVHFRQTSAQAACVLCWLCGLGLALGPLLPPTSHWHFYQQSSICLPLPVTRQHFEGRPYSFGVMVILNSLLFLLIAAGQAFIYHAIRKNSLSMVDGSKASGKELTIARRLITVAMSDFLCWFPIGMLGLLASQNVAIPGEVRVGLAIFVLPLNSALNPFLYTLNVIREKRRQAYFQRLQALFHSQNKVKATPQSANTH